MAVTNRQVDFATALAGQLDEDGFAISTADVLDALASSGLQLDLDLIGAATEAYKEHVAERSE